MGAERHLRVRDRDRGVEHGRKTLADEQLAQLTAYEQREWTRVLKGCVDFLRWARLDRGRFRRLPRFGRFVLAVPSATLRRRRRVGTRPGPGMLSIVVGHLRTRYIGGRRAGRHQPGRAGLKRPAPPLWRPHIDCP